jgi:hypothetical protein
MYVGVPGFFEAFFGEVASLEPAALAWFEKCKEGQNLLYRAAEHPPASARRRPLAQHHNPLQEVHGTDAAKK